MFSVGSAVHFFSEDFVFADFMSDKVMYEHTAVMLDTRTKQVTPVMLTVDEAQNGKTLIYNGYTEDKDKPEVHLGAVHVSGRYALMATKLIQKVGETAYLLTVDVLIYDSQLHTVKLCRTIDYSWPHDFHNNNLEHQEAHLAFIDNYLYCLIGEWRTYYRGDMRRAKLLKLDLDVAESTWVSVMAAKEEKQPSCMVPVGVEVVAASVPRQLVMQLPVCTLPPTYGIPWR
jgi:hypothetical protein